MGRTRLNIGNQHYCGGVSSPVVITIDDPNDTRLSDFQRLIDARFRTSIESPGPFHRGFCVAEGWIVIERLLRSRHAVRNVYVVDSKLERALEMIGSRPLTVYTAPASVVYATVGFPLHRGILASADRGLPLLASNVVRRNRRLVICEGITNPENLGAIVRNAAALGATGVLVDNTSCDLLSRRVIRVSMGHALLIESARGSIDQLIGLAQRVGIDCLGLTPDADATDLDVLERRDDLAVVLGAEGPGLSPQALALCDRRVRIEMAAGVDSLNVATAGAIAMNRLFVRS